MFLAIRRSAVLVAISLAFCSPATLAASRPALQGLPSLSPFVYRYNFGAVKNGQLDGSTPKMGVISDGTGSLYGVTYRGGADAAYGGDGTVFKLSPTSSGGYAESIIYSFYLNPDGTGIYGPYDLIADKAGNLVGIATFQFAPTESYSTVFELKLTSKGYVYQDIVANIDGKLVADSAGALYGIGKHTVPPEPV